MSTTSSPTSFPTSSPTYGPASEEVTSSLMLATIILIVIVTYVYFVSGKFDYESEMKESLLDCVLEEKHLKHEASVPTEYTSLLHEH